MWRYHNNDDRSVLTEILANLEQEYSRQASDQTKWRTNIVDVLGVEMGRPTVNSAPWPDGVTT